MPRPRKTPTTSNIDFSSIDSSFSTGEVLKLKNLASQFGICIPVLRRLLAEHYGTRIEFVRGRTGGIRYRAIASTQTIQATPVAVNEETPTLVSAA
jgi:hypothetical protein